MEFLSTASLVLFGGFTVITITAFLVGFFYGRKVGRVQVEEGKV